MPPFWHGDGEQGMYLDSQFFPVYPGSQLHLQKKQKFNRKSVKLFPVLILIILLLPHLLVRSVRVGALAAMPTGPLQALLNVLLAGLALESARAVALELAAVAHRLTRAPVLARRRGAYILLLAVPARVSWHTRALVLVQRLEHAAAMVLARRRVAGRLLGDLTERGGEPDRTLADEARRSVVLDQRRARAAVLAPLAGPRLAGIRQFTVVANVSGRATMEMVRRERVGKTGCWLKGSLKKKK